MTTFALAFPEIFLALNGLLLLLWGAFCGDKSTRHVAALTVAAFGVAGVMVAMGGVSPTAVFHDMFTVDAYARFVKLALLLGAAISVVLSLAYLDHTKLARPEYPVLVLFATLGMMLMISAHDLMALYVGLELQSLSLYVLAAFRRDDTKSSEAGLKYFVLGALSSGMLLYGISLLYGFAGSTNFAELTKILTGPSPATGAVVGLVFVAAALAFKVSAVPFHMWTPDVYEGAPTPVTAFFAAVPKLAALAVMVRLFRQPLGGMEHSWGQIVIFLAAASMILGSFAGVVQNNIKRLMAYSSIANVGIALTGLAVLSADGVQALLVYLVIYFINVLGAFGVILCLRKQGEMIENVSDLAGISKTHPVLAATMAVFMFSLAGIPPLAGFFGKYFVFLAAVKAGYMPLAILGVLTSVVAAYYYLRVLKVMYFDEPTGAAFDPVPEYTLRAVTAVAAIAVLGFILVPNVVIEQAHLAAQSLMGG